jgi:hypothetical protein
MSIINSERTCLKCITSIDLLFKNHNLNSKILDEFITEMLSLSLSHFSIMENTLSEQEKSRCHLKHMQAELLLAIMRRVNLGD